MKFKLPLFLIFLSLFSFGQNKVENLDSITINAQRIALPFSKNSRTITLITASQIKNSPATSVAQLLQNYTGIDVRQRGLEGMQADLYIRGGSFDQTLLLIDGIAVEDSQTGHHLLNSLPAIEMIERIEIIKGPAARIYGQNAFTGAINIITKKADKNYTKLQVATGSFNNTNVGLIMSQKSENLSQIFQVKRHTSAGYRFNTDFKNNHALYKANFKIKDIPFSVLATYADRKFGANGFYASPDFKDQYEETQTSLVGLSTTYKTDNYKVNSRLYWKRNQDMYVFLRYNPTYFRNFHITNKVGASFNSTVTSDKGITGFGIDIAKNYIVSNNLGAHNRYVATGFIEHRFNFSDGKFDVTPGVALNYYSDFNFHAFPGVDLGLQLNPNTRIYGNVGYTYRVPTYTDLFYSSPTTAGNVDLIPEEAVAEELGLKFSKSNFSFDMAIFNRQSKNLIDYVKNNPTDKWEANNLRKVNSYGVEINSVYHFEFKGYNQSVKMGYNYLKDNVKQVNVPFSRYSLNSIKHQIVATLNTKFFKHFSQSVHYRFVERPDGSHYTVFDAKINFVVKNVAMSLSGNNIFNAIYSETSLVPMPKSNYLMRLTYTFK
jgi:vitamin B12 transporter